MRLPSKTFVIGEYVVLQGGPAILMATPPYFDAQPSKRSLIDQLNPQSPAVRLLTSVAAFLDPREICLEWIDPHQESGGFGASSAQFIFAYRALAERLGWSTGWKSIWEKFIAITRQPNGQSPSGADVVVQVCGGVVEFDPTLPQVIEMPPPQGANGVAVFSAAHQESRKTPTHVHLNELVWDEKKTLDLIRCVDAVRAAWSKQDPRGVGKGLTDFSEILCALGLEHAATRADRLALMKADGICGVKGTGALLSDGIIVSYDTTQTSLQSVCEIASQRDLKWLGAV